MQQAHPKLVTFVLGGARSGKSRFAQKIASGFANVAFIATATPSDPEMELRIERHRKSRPASWHTLEMPWDLDVAISGLQDTKQLAVIDCLTVYLANVMSKTQGKESAIRESMERLCSALVKVKSSVIVVSNEVGSGIHAPTQTGRLYTDLLGELNQKVAALAANVILMVAGIPVPIKGNLPIQTQSGSKFHSEVLIATR